VTGPGHISQDTHQCHDCGAWPGLRREEVAAAAAQIRGNEKGRAANGLITAQGKAQGGKLSYCTALAYQCAPCAQSLRCMLFLDGRSVLIRAKKPRGPEEDERRKGPFPFVVSLTHTTRLTGRRPSDRQMKAGRWVPRSHKAVTPQHYGPK
jgi:hypothetical protein